MSLRRGGPGDVEAAKAQAKAGGEVAWVSTNDVVTSAFLRLTGCRTGFMALDCRGRVEGCRAEQAGNMEFGIIYEPADFASPALIRQSLSGLRRAARPKTRLPGTWGRLRARIAMVTNWATNSKELALPGCEHVLQVPYMDPGFVPCEICVVFQPRAGEVAALSFTTEDVWGRPAEQLAPFGQPLEGMAP